MGKFEKLILCSCFLLPGLALAAPAKKLAPLPTLRIDGRPFAGALVQRGTETFIALSAFLQAADLTRRDLDKQGLPASAYILSGPNEYVSLQKTAEILKWTLEKDEEKRTYALWSKPKETLSGSCPVSLELTYVDTPALTARKYKKPSLTIIPGPIRIYVKAQNAGKKEIKKVTVLCLYTDPYGKELHKEEQTLINMAPGETRDMVFFWSNPTAFPAISHKLSVKEWE